MPSSITSDQMEQMQPGSGRFADPINKTIDNYSINNTAMFIAQICHESSGLQTFVENLNYSEQGLLTTFPRYFDATTAPQYAHNPQAIANRVYANRLGNGDEASGEGWLYRGRGAIQLTGKTNYLRFGQDVGMTSIQVVQYLSTDEGAIMSAGWFWYDVNINSVSSDINATTRKINGGLNGLPARQALYSRAQSIFGS